MSKAVLTRFWDEMTEDLEANQQSVDHFNARRKTYISYIDKALNLIGKMTGYKTRDNDVMTQPPLSELKIHTVSIH